MPRDLKFWPTDPNFAGEVESELRSGFRARNEELKGSNWGAYVKMSFNCEHALRTEAKVIGKLFREESFTRNQELSVSASSHARTRVTVATQSFRHNNPHRSSLVFCLHKREGFACLHVVIILTSFLLPEVCWRSLNYTNPQELARIHSTELITTWAWMNDDCHGKQNCRRSWNTFMESNDFSTTIHSIKYKELLRGDPNAYPTN